MYNKAPKLVRHKPSLTATLKQLQITTIAKLNNRPLANSWAAFITFIESAPLWQKSTAGLILSLPLLITGIALQLTNIIMIGILGAAVSLIVVSLLEYYKKHHQKEKQFTKEMSTQVDDEISHLVEQLDSFSQEVDSYQCTSAETTKQLTQQVTRLTQQKKNLQATVTDLQRSDEILKQLTESLTSENQALHHVITEKNRLATQQEQKIKEFHEALDTNTHQQMYLSLELKKHQELELTLTTQIKTLTEQNVSQKHLVASTVFKVQQMHSQLNKMVRQRRYLVSQIKEKMHLIDAILSAKKNLELEVQQGIEEQQKLKCTVKELELRQVQLQHRVTTLNLKLFEHCLVQEKTEQLLEGALTTVQSMQQKNEWLRVQLEALSQQNELLTQQVTTLAAVQKELLTTKTQMQQVITTLEKQITTQGAALTTSQQQLKIALNDYITTRKTLDATVKQLVLVKNEMTQEMEHLKNTRSMLAKTIIKLSEAVSSDEKNKEDFLTQLKQTIQQKEDNFAQIAQGVVHFNQCLTTLSSEFKICITRHKHLLDLQEQNIQRLDLLNNNRSQVTPFSIFHHEQHAVVLPSFCSEGQVVPGH